MTHPTDYLSHPQSEGGQRLHTQESGDAGLSSNLNHKITVDYDDGPFPVPSYSSFVKPIPKEEFKIFERPAFTKKIGSLSSEFGYAVVQAGEFEGRFIKSSTVKQNYPPGVTQKDLEEETVKGLPLTAAITEEHSDAEVEGEETTFVKTKMKSHKNAEMPNLRPQRDHVFPAGKKRNVSKKRAPVKNRISMAVVFVFICAAAATRGGSAAPFRSPVCFKCADENKCPNLKSVFSTSDTSLYHRGLNQTLPGCSDVCPPAERCNVCSAQRDVLIVCSEGVMDLEVEGDGHEISITPASWKDCEHKLKTHNNCSETPAIIKDKREAGGRARYFWIAGVIWAAVVLCLFGLYLKKRT